MKFLLKKNLGKLKRGTVLVRHGVVVVYKDTSFDLKSVLKNEEYFQEIE